MAARTCSRCWRRATTVSIFVSSSVQRRSVDHRERPESDVRRNPVEARGCRGDGREVAEGREVVAAAVGKANQPPMNADARRWDSVIDHRDFRFGDSGFGEYILYEVRNGYVVIGPRVFELRRDGKCDAARHDQRRFSIEQRQRVSSCIVRVDEIVMAGA